MPGVPPVSPRLGLPRYDSTDRATYWSQTNAVSDRLDVVAARTDDARFTDARPPAPGSVTNASVAADAAIDQAKLNLLVDAGAGTASLRTLGSGANQAVAGNDPRFSTPAAPAAHGATHQEGAADDIGLPPIGSIVAYAGVALPTVASGGSQRWDWADGGLIDRTTYATFFNRTQHTYNGGVDPGSNKVRKPDKRGRSSIGASTYGQGAAPATNARAQVARGSAGGEVAHQLMWNEGSVNSNGSAAAVDINHGHGITEDGWHAHTTGGGTQVFQSGGNAFTIRTDAAQYTMHYYPLNTDGAGSHSHGGGTDWMSQNNVHGHSLTARNADAAHNVLGPYEADTYLVRIA